MGTADSVLGRVERLYDPKKKVVCTGSAAAPGKQLTMAVERRFYAPAHGAQQISQQLFHTALLIVRLQLLSAQHLQLSSGRVGKFALLLRLYSTCSAAWGC